MCTPAVSLTAPSAHRPSCAPLLCRSRPCETSPTRPRHRPTPHLGDQSRELPALGEAQAQQRALQGRIPAQGLVGQGAPSVLHEAPEWAVELLGSDLGWGRVSLGPALSAGAAFRAVPRAAGLAPHNAQPMVAQSGEHNPPPSLETHTRLRTSRHCELCPSASGDRTAISKRGRRDPLADPRANHAMLECILALGPAHPARQLAMCKRSPTAHALRKHMTAFAAQTARRYAQTRPRLPATIARSEPPPQAASSWIESSLYRSRFAG